MLRILRRPRAPVVASVLLVAALAALRTGDTLAGFTDRDDAGPNTFVAAGVQLSSSPTTALMSYTGMQPGNSVTSSIVVTNSGSARLRYAISSSATNADGKGLKDQLVLTVKTIDVTTPARPCDDFDGSQLYVGDLDSTSGRLVGDNARGAQAGDRTLDPSSSETLCFRVWLPLNTGASYQSASTTATFTFDSEQTAFN